MGKIGILTFHRSYNYGAFMQCYSLSHRLMRDFPQHEVEVIDYATQRVYANYPTELKEYLLGTGTGRPSLKKVMINVGRLMLSPKYLQQRKALYSAFQKDLAQLPLSEEFVCTDDYEALFEAIKDKYDAIVVGSDAVWEFKTYPFPNAYFLNGDLGNTSLLSYAASTARMHPSDIDENAADYLKTAYSRFRYLGVRDVSTENLLHHINPDLALNHNCDPTVLLDLDALPKGLDRVKAELAANHIDLKKPIICVMGGNKLCRIVRKMFKKKYQIVSVYYHSKYADHYLDGLSPIEWAQVFSLFSVTVTSFFHGSLLSLKNGCPTVATDYWRQVDSEHITKIGDLYRRLNLTDHYFYMANVTSNEDFSKMKERIEYYIENPDKKAIAQALEKEGESYYSFRDALEKVLAEK